MVKKWWSNKDNDGEVDDDKEDESTLGIKVSAHGTLILKTTLQILNSAN